MVLHSRLPLRERWALRRGRVLCHQRTALLRRTAVLATSITGLRVVRLSSLLATRWGASSFTSTVVTIWRGIVTTGLIAIGLLGGHIVTTAVAFIAAVVAWACFTRTSVRLTNLSTRIAPFTLMIDYGIAIRWAATIVARFSWATALGASTFGTSGIDYAVLNVRTCTFHRRVCFWQSSVDRPFIGMNVRMINHACTSDIFSVYAHHLTPDRM